MVLVTLPNATELCAQSCRPGSLLKLRRTGRSWVFDYFSARVVCVHVCVGSTLCRGVYACESPGLTAAPPSSTFHSETGSLHVRLAGRLACLYPPHALNYHQATTPRGRLLPWDLDRWSSDPAGTSQAEPLPRAQTLLKVPCQVHRAMRGRPEHIEPQGTCLSLPIPGPQHPVSPHSGAADSPAGFKPDSPLPSPALTLLKSHLCLH